MAARPIQPRELLDLADELIGGPDARGRPRTIRLRRAVSSAYYALFHELSFRIVTTTVQPPPWDERSAAVARWIAHTDLQALCKAGTGAGNSALRAAIGPVSADRSRIAVTFLDLQDARHRADYDDTYNITRPAVVALLADARDAVETSYSLIVTSDDGYRRFLSLGLGAVRIAKERSS